MLSPTGLAVGAIGLLLVAFFVGPRLSLEGPGPLPPTFASALEDIETLWQRRRRVRADLDAAAQRDGIAQGHTYQTAGGVRLTRSGLF